ncbi:MAG: HaeIII family restriction endonuclease [Akkermansiaceae bacterium]|jgi:hypothetical protein
MKNGGKQTFNGKAFEYSLLRKLQECLNRITPVSIVNSTSLDIAQKCYMDSTIQNKKNYDLSALKAVEVIMQMEPRLSHGVSDKDELQLTIVADAEGQLGDVRDVIAIRSMQDWQIGISAKNNHKAVKHSRLSQDINFGTKWLDTPCSKNYFSSIKPIFDTLNEIKLGSKSEAKWSGLRDKHDQFYVPILNSFKTELLALYEMSSEKVASNLVSYLIGNKDFYKVIKARNKVEIEAYNFNGTLNQTFRKIKSNYSAPRTKLPDKLIDICFSNKSKTTLIVTLNEGWQISFRIHNASSKVEASLKFDINLVSSPNSLFKTHIALS